MYGLAIGDALGAPIEMQKAGKFEPITGYRDPTGHKFNHGLTTGEWTDDTSMALALADAIAQGDTPKDHLDAYVAWYRKGKYSSTGVCAGMGGHTRRSLESYITTERLTAVQNETALGNGAIMRLAPVAIRYAEDSRLREIARRSSITTHNNEMHQSACEYMAVVLSGLMRGLSRVTVLDKDWEETAGLELHPEIRKIANGGFLTEEPTGIGHVVETLRSALWAFATTNSFKECVLDAVNLGNDADTTGAVAGQFAGAYYGYNAIPEELIDGLAKKEMIDEYLNKIL